MQHPTARWLALDAFASISRWVGEGLPAGDTPIEATVAAMDKGGVQHGLLNAWYGPEGPLISNDEVAAWVRQHPTRFSGLAGVDLRRPMDGVRELRRCVTQLGFVGLRVIPWLW